MVRTEQLAFFQDCHFEAFIIICHPLESGNDKYWCHYDLLRDHPLMRAS